MKNFPRTAVFIFFLASLCTPAVAADEKPHSDYCEMVTKRIVDKCAPIFTNDERVALLTEVDDKGKTVHWEKLGACDQAKTMAILKATEDLPPPPANLMRPVRLIISTTHKLDDLRVRLSNVDYAQYNRNIQKSVKKQWLALAPDQTRITKVKFVVWKNGQVQKVKVAFSSGSDKADAEALLAVKNAAPFGPLPEGGVDLVEVEMTVDGQSLILLSK